MPSLLKKTLTSEAFLALLYRFIRTYSATFRITVVNEKPWMDHLQRGGSVLLCTWHQQFFAAIRHFQNYRDHKPSLMISKSRDGVIIAGVARRTGWRTALGSSSRSGTEALKEMIRNIRESRLGAHVLDGPRGPAGKIKPGVIRLAHAADALVVPFYTSADRAWYFNSWDNFLLPKPFSRVTLTYGDMIRFNPTTDPDEFESQRIRLEEIMRPGLQGRLAAS